DVLHDRQRDGERFASVLARHRNGRLAGDRLDKRLELESQRFAFRRIDGDALDERLERLRALCVTYERAKVDVLSQSVALDSSRAEVEREVSRRLEDAKFAQPLSRHAARGDVGNGAGLE